MNLFLISIMALSLTPRQQALSAIAACEAKGDQVALTACFEKATLMGHLFCGGVNDPQDISGNVRLV